MRLNSRFLAMILLVLIGCIARTDAISQQRSRNAVYLEGASRGPVYSVNYDRILRQGQQLAWSARLGLSVEKNAVSFPFGLNLITGLNRHHAAFDLTLIPYLKKVDKNDPSNNDGSDKYFYINPSIGYRFQQAEKGIFLKAFAGPSIFLDPAAGDFWNMDPKFYVFAGVGAGISF
jgi:hypothetical protein